MERCPRLRKICVFQACARCGISDTRKSGIKRFEFNVNVTRISLSFRHILCQSQHLQVDDGVRSPKTRTQDISNSNVTLTILCKYHKKSQIIECEQSKIAKTEKGVTDKLRTIAGWEVCLALVTQLKLTYHDNISMEKACRHSKMYRISHCRSCPGVFDVFGRLQLATSHSSPSQTRQSQPPRLQPHRHYPQQSTRPL